MAKRILLKRDLNNALLDSIVSFSFLNEKTKEINFAFFTKNEEIIRYVEPETDLSFANESDKVYAFDILSKSVKEIHPGFFAGDVFEVASVGEPSVFSEIVDAKLYLGDLTGAKSISRRLYDSAKDLDVEDIGIKNDNLCYVFDTVLELKNQSDILMANYNEQYLSAIYLVK